MGRVTGRGSVNAGSLCSGVGGLDRGLERAGCRVIWQCEQSAYRRGVLARHWPEVPCHEDLTTLDPGDLPEVDLLAAGTPCPDFSHAKAERRGLEGEESRLFWDFARIRNALAPEWTLWENVDGALTTHDGLDFALVLEAFVGAPVHVPRGGWPRAGVVAGPWGGAVWRVLDAQHFGTPQRRHRVFVVGRLSGPCPPEVLLEPQGGRGDPAPRDETPEDVARSLGSSVAGTLGAYAGRGGLTRSQVVDGHGAYVAAGEPLLRPFVKGTKAHHDEDHERWEDAEVAPTVSAAGGDANGTVVVPFGVTTYEGDSPRGAWEADAAPSVRADHGSVDPGCVVGTFVVRSKGSNARAAARDTDVATTLLSQGSTAGAGTAGETVVVGLRGVRRLTPTECERLQGLPDGWTIPWGPSLRDARAWHELEHDERAALPVPWDPPVKLDTPRRSGCGDAVCASVAEWIGRRLLSAAKAATVIVDG